MAGQITLHIASVGACPQNHSHHHIVVPIAPTSQSTHRIIYLHEVTLQCKCQYSFHKECSTPLLKSSINICSIIQQIMVSIPIRRGNWESYQDSNLNLRSMLAIYRTLQQRHHVCSNLNDNSLLLSFSCFKGNMQAYLRTKYHRRYIPHLQF